MVIYQCDRCKETIAEIQAGYSIDTQEDYNVKLMTENRTHLYCLCKKCLQEVLEFLTKC